MVVRQQSTSNIRKALACMLIGVLISAGAIAAWNLSQPPLDTGSQIISQGSMTDEQSLALLDEQARKSRITVSLQPKPKLADGRLRINFLVPEENNGFAERLEIEQDGKLLYKSGIVKPGSVIEWCKADDAHAGSAVATVYAVEEKGTDTGNPIAVEVEIQQDDALPTEQDDVLPSEQGDAPLAQQETAESKERTA